MGAACGDVAGSEPVSYFVGAHTVNDVSSSISLILRHSGDAADAKRRSDLGPLLSVAPAASLSGFGAFYPRTLG
jgi:hypothetical protein